MGIHRAGFDVTGVDIKPQKNYPFRFVQADALKPPFDLGHFDFIWASPPCQKYTKLNQGLSQSRGCAKEHPDLIAPVREMLVGSGKPYVIENVPGAPLINPVKLCGSSFDLMVERHRLFESNVMILAPLCEHGRQAKDKPPLHRLQGNHSRVVGCYGHSRGKADSVDLWREAMGVDWTRKREELAQAIPPAYSEFLCRQIFKHLPK